MNEENNSLEFAAYHAHKWVKAWNDHNLDAILSLYADEVEFSSPKIKVILGENKNCTITSKTELRKYFSAGLKRFPNLKFNITDFTVSRNKLVLEYSANLEEKSILNVIEKFEFEDGLVKKSGAYYGFEQAIHMK